MKKNVHGINGNMNQLISNRSTSLNQRQVRQLEGNDSGNNGNSINNNNNNSGESINRVIIDLLELSGLEKIQIYLYGM